MYRKFKRSFKRKYSGRGRYGRSARRSYRSTSRYGGGSTRKIKRVVQAQSETKILTNTTISQLVATGGQLKNYYDGFPGVTLDSYLDSFAPLQLIPKGVDRNCREGDKVTVKAIEYRYVINTIKADTDFLNVYMFSAPQGFLPTYRSVFQFARGDIRIDRTNPNVRLLCYRKHVLNPLNQIPSAAGTGDQTQNGHYIVGNLTKRFPGGLQYRYEYSSTQATTLNFSRNREIFIAVVGWRPTVLVGTATSEQTLLDDQSLCIKFKDI